jgi:serine protease AprX
MGMNKRGRATTPTLAFDGLAGVALHVRRITTLATATALAAG